MSASFSFKIIQLWKHCKNCHIEYLFQLVFQFLTHTEMKQNILKDIINWKKNIWIPIDSLWIQKNKTLRIWISSDQWTLNKFESWDYLTLALLFKIIWNFWFTEIKINYPW